MSADTAKTMAMNGQKQMDDLDAQIPTLQAQVNEDAKALETAKANVDTAQKKADTSNATWQAAQKKKTDVAVGVAKAWNAVYEFTAADDLAKDTDPDAQAEAQKLRDGAQQKETDAAKLLS